MRAIFLGLMVLLAGCDDFGPRRYELITASGSVYLLDTKSGRVWAKTSIAFEPMWIMRDSRSEADLNDVLLRPAFKNDFEESFSYKPNTWGDFFRGLKK